MIQFSIIIPFKFLTSNLPHALFDVFQMVEKKNQIDLHFSVSHAIFWMSTRANEFIQFSLSLWKANKKQTLWNFVYTFLLLEKQVRQQEPKGEENWKLLHRLSFCCVELHEYVSVSRTRRSYYCILSPKARTLVNSQDLNTEKKKHKIFQRASFNRRLSSCEDFKFGYFFSESTKSFLSVLFGS